MSYLPKMQEVDIIANMFRVLFQIRSENVRSVGCDRSEFWFLKCESIPFYCIRGKCMEMLSLYVKLHIVII